MCPKTAKRPTLRSGLLLGLTGRLLTGPLASTVGALRPDQADEQAARKVLRAGLAHHTQAA
jgi:hypothetical protein